MPNWCVTRYRGTNADTGKQQEYTIGSRVLVTCRPRRCRITDPDAPPPCIVGAGYKEGCCVASDPGCTEENQCGELCANDIPNKIDGCEDLTSLDCYTWDDNEYLVYLDTVNYDCFNSGTFDDGNERYKWAIMCGPQYE